MIKEANLIVPVKCKVQETAVAIAKKMKDTKARYVFIVDEKRTPIGIVSAVDIITRVVAESKDPSKIKAKDIMTTPIKVVMDKDSVEQAYKLMASEDIYSVPVVSDGQLIGVLNFDEAMRILSKKGTKKR